MEVFLFCPGVLMILFGGMLLFAPDMAWEWTKFSNSLRGLPSERSATYDTGRTINGLITLGMGVFLCAIILIWNPAGERREVESSLTAVSQLGTEIRTTLSSVASSTPDLGPVRVSRVIDGDTIEIRLDGETYRVRYIGIDAPALDAACGAEARAANAALVEGKTLRLESDLLETDDAGQWLRYVYLDDQMVNAELVRQGLAQPLELAPNLRHQSDFATLARYAPIPDCAMINPTPTP